MSDFIILHDKEDGKVYINKNQISDFARTNDGKYTRVFLGGEAEDFYTVKESPEEIYNMIQTKDLLKGETLSVADDFFTITMDGARASICKSEILGFVESGDNTTVMFKDAQRVPLVAKEPFHEVCRRAGIVVPLKTEKGDLDIIKRLKI